MNVVNIGEQFLLGENKPVGDVFDSPGTLISLILKNVYVVAGIILFFFIIAGGLIIITGAGNSDKQKQGSKTITSALIGFLILFSSFWIIRIIESLTGIQIINPL